MKDIKSYIAWIVLGFVGFGIILFSSYMIVNRVGIDLPVISSVEKMEGVVEARVTSRRPDFSVEVKVDKLADFSEFCNAVKSDVKSKNASYVNIYLLDTRDEALENAYKRAQFILFSSEKNGDFLNVEKELSLELGRYGCKLESIDMDYNNFYIHFSHEDKHMYEIIKRNDVDQSDKGVTFITKRNRNILS